MLISRQFAPAILPPQSCEAKPIVGPIRPLGRRVATSSQAPARHQPPRPRPRAPVCSLPLALPMTWALLWTWETRA